MKSINIVNKINMRQKVKLLISLAIVITAFSCKTSKMSLNIPSELSARAERVGVSGITGKGLPGAKRTINFEKDFTGQFKDGWVVSSDIYDKTPGGMFSAEATKRNLLQNAGININNVISKRVDKFQFTISDSNKSIIAFCHQQYLGKSLSYNIKNRVDFSTATNQASSFVCTFSQINKTGKTEWLLVLSYDRETPGGIIATTLRKGMAIEKGFIANSTDTIYIKPVFVDRNAGKIPENSPFKSFEVVGGYEFTLNQITIGIVDLFNRSIWFFPDSNTNYKTIVAAAGTALLLRVR